MIDILIKEIEKNGDTCRIIPVERLQDLKHDIEDFQIKEDLNGFQKFIINNIYQLELPDVDFPIYSIILIATPAPSYAKVIFNDQGKKYHVISLARSRPGKKHAPEATKQYLTALLKPEGYHIKHAPQLPLKRLGVRTGLAEYGRNNICYSHGMGSFFTFTAYFSDIQCSEDSWQKIRQMEACSDCSACLNNCPTGAILKDRFLINNEKCLSFLNERPGDFPEWLPVSAHNCLYDCLKCQTVCPQNKDYLNNIIGPIEFDQVETGMLLAGKPMNEFPLQLKKKVKFLDMDKYLPSIARNMRVLFEKYSDINK